jgi:hypothetical protein
MIIAVQYNALNFGEWATMSHVKVKFTSFLIIFHIPHTALSAILFSCIFPNLSDFNLL